MALTQRMIEEVVAWSWNSSELASARREAWPHFFGDDDPRPVKYWSNAEELVSRERRFLGYFLFNWQLPSGERPVEIAIRDLYRGPTQAEALTAVAGARFVLAVVTGIWNQSVGLEMEKERFEVRSRQLARSLSRETVIAAHLVPVRFGYWLLGPGWVNLPFKFGPGIRANLTSWQLDPISLERQLQGRSEVDEKARPEPPRDQDLETAVSRMTNWAKERNEDALIMSQEEWQASVLRNLPNLDSIAFYEQAMAMVSARLSETELQELVDLLTNIWNNTPQPDRGGLTANQLIRQRNRSG
jgi:hypothetical protein